MKRILIAGIGNIFFGDDAFGVEVVRELSRLALPPEIQVKDFGIRGYDLATALSDGCDVAILVDATSRGEKPGTLFLIRPDLANLGMNSTLDGHNLDPVHVLQMAESFGGCPEEIYLVGCEPAELGGDEGRMGLSEAVQSAVPKAVKMIHTLVDEILNKQGELQDNAVAG